ncbi:MAG TPA: NAD(P)-binding domain-containing protein, partial [Blastocatellia bacterium]|nr:NAD(P)-binding domain-containing protein [Blastocatellia bacterium]
AALSAGIVSQEDEAAGGFQRTRFGSTAAGLSARLRAYGALPWYVWVLVAAAAPVIGLSLLVIGSSREKSAIAAEAAAAPTAPQLEPGRSIDLDKLKEEGPPYPHPVIDPLLCIGCHACVEACPHDVIAIVNGVANPVAPDQCMEDTGCQVECPTSPKACVVINTTKPIPSRKVPSRNQKLMTNVEGIYMVGDVSGVPLIKNAINEGGQVIDLVLDDLQHEGPASSAQYDVAVVGVGPAGLSAAVIAKQRGLRYVAIEQDKVVATIQAYPAGKYVFFKPDTVQAKGGIPLPGPGDKKETMIESWIATMRNTGVLVNEEESCKDIKRQGNVFLITTEKDKLKEQASYTARRVILAIGNRGTPMRLGVSGEDMKIMIQPPPVMPKFCPKCGTPPRGTQSFCGHCGETLPRRAGQPREETKVKYKLTDPDDYVNKKCIVVGAGNSAVEAAVDLCGLERNGDQISFTRHNEVTLVVRSDFKGDLKLGNKINVYDCIDSGRIKVYYRTELKEIREKEVALMDGRSKKETSRIANDFVFALIGGERPTKFLEKIGIKIG